MTYRMKSDHVPASANRPPQGVSVKFISLGCPKNLVDSEVMAGILAKNRFKLVPQTSPSDVVVVNTCGFIEDAKRESIETIFEVARAKKNGEVRLLVVAGCLSQRYKDELPKLIPEVDAFMGTGDFSHLKEIIEQKLGGDEQRNFIRHPSEQISMDLPRVDSGPAYSRYVKVSEGCSHACSFCTIPLMRGGLRSRPTGDIVREITESAEKGVKEFNLIAQDLNEYGRDLPTRESLYGLLEKLAPVGGDFWLRLLYMYPLQFPDKLIGLIKDHPHVLPYVDIPLQHIDDAILKSMNRGSSAHYIHRLVDKLRTAMPAMTLRTTFIVGYPGETDEQFEKLLQFVREARFDRVGAFTYSDEDGTPAYKLKEKLPEKIREERKFLLMEEQRKISREKNLEKVGKNLKVLYEGKNLARHAGQAPEIDGVTHLPQPVDSALKPGDFVNIKITRSDDYDLWGEFV